MERAAWGGRVLVTGSTGFIGKHLLPRLTGSGAPIRCLVRRPLSIPGAETVRGDLATGEGLREAARDVDLVLHLAGVTKALRPEDYDRGNATGTGNLVANCPPGAKLIHISSLAAAGPSPDGLPLREDATPRPVSLYGRSKLASEEAVRASPLAARAVILRPAVVYGPADTDVYQAFRSVARGVFATIGSGQARFSYIYVEDLVDAILAAASSPVAEGRTYFLANPKPVSWFDFASLAGQQMGHKVRFLRIPLSAAWLAGWAAELSARFRRERPGILSRDKVREAAHPDWICDPDRAFRDFGFLPTTSLANGMAVTLAWYKKAGWLT